MSANPYLIEPPFSISFSGGRTSGYLLYKILEAYDGQLPDETCVVFANTGKEFPETLDFVHACETRWNVSIQWVEYKSSHEGRTRWKLVSYETASRDGKPFSDLLDDKQYLPNPVARICTARMKIEPIRHCSRYYCGLSFTQCIGIRYDEPRRWGIRGEDQKWPSIWNEIPLVPAQVTKSDVLSFWSAQSFDLQLAPEESNCDCCFLKGAAKLVKIIQDHPGIADWWEQQEARGRSSAPDGASFRRNRSYTKLKQIALASALPILPNDDLGECRCHD